MHSESSYKKLYKESKTDNIKLKQIIEMQTTKMHNLEAQMHNQEAQMHNQEAQMHNQEAQIKNLTAKLAFYDNPNTPPSSNSLTRQARRSRSRIEKKKNTEGRPGHGGAKNGHTGTTNKPVPTKFEAHEPKKCTRCGSSRLVITKINQRDIAGMPPPPPPATTRHTIYTCSCSNCGRKDITPDTGLPEKGSYGRRVITEVISNYIERIPNRRNAARMDGMGIQMSPGTIHGILQRTGNNTGKLPLQAIIKSMREARILNVDETSMRLNGVTIWVWVFYNPMTGDTLFVMRPSRGRSVIEEVLEEDWKGIIVCDGLSPYASYKIQRCWAHIITEMRHVSESDPRNRAAARALRVLTGTCRDARAAIPGRMSKRTRLRMQSKLVRRVRNLISRHSGDDDMLKNLMKKIGRALPNLFRFVLDPRIPPTNNAAERALREVAVHRKIRGGIRSKDTAVWLGNLLTCVTTWKNKGIDYLAEIAKYA